MLSNTLILSSTLSLTAAAIYLIVGLRIRSRKIVEKNAHEAWQVFANYWIALAVSAGLTALTNILGSLGNMDLSLFVLISNLSLFAASYAVYALLYYLLFIFTGNPKWQRPVIYFYAAFFLGTFYLFSSNKPIGITIEAWSVSILYETPLEGVPLLTVLVFLIVPTLVGSLAYLSLYSKVRDTSQKYRILMVSISILVWFGTSLVASASGADNADIWPMISRLIGISAAAAIYFAYFPPSWAQKRWKLEAVR